MNDRKKTIRTRARNIFQSLTIITSMALILAGIGFLIAGDEGCK